MAFTICLLWSSFPSSLPNFFIAISSKDRPTVDRKNSARYRANLLAEHWRHSTPTSNVLAFAVSFAESYKFHSLLGSVRELSGSLQNRRISGASAIHERAREARGPKYPPVITPLFMLFRPQHTLYDQPITVLEKQWWSRRVVLWAKSYP